MARPTPQIGLLAVPNAGRLNDAVYQAFKDFIEIPIPRP